jgi:hypothetical protein
MAQSQNQLSAACRRFDSELLAYLEGEARPLITSHAQDCLACAALLADLEWIQQAARELPQEEPSPVVWANIHARLEAEGAFGKPAGGWRQIFAWRALPHAIPLGALAILVFMGSWLTLSSNTVPPLGASAEAVKTSEATPTNSAVLTNQEGVLASLATDLENSFHAREASMAPELKATYEKSLVSLDGSITECLESLRHEPKNTLARDYLLTAYSRKAEILSAALEFEGR